MPESPVWAREPHTAAKHRILEEYLKAWYPILSTSQNRLIYIDGFAGPSKYLKGEDGSPIIAIRCLLNHSRNLCQAGNKEFVFLFIEQDAERSALLDETIKKEYPDLPKSIKCRTYNGDFETAMKQLLDVLDKEGKSLAPTFAFIDPFGYSGLPFYLIQRILKFRRCEVFINFAYNSINLFIETTDSREEIFDALFGTPEWRKIRGVKDPEERNRQLIELYSSQLKKAAKYVRSFEMVDKTGKITYHLFFATNHIEGIKQMKTAMWKVDPRGLFHFADTTDAGQTFLLEYGNDSKFWDQAEIIYQNFAGKTASKEVLDTYCTESTAFPHLWSGSLKILESDGRLTVTTHRKRSGTYPERCVVTFKEK